MVEGRRRVDIDLNTGPERRQSLLELLIGPLTRLFERQVLEDAVLYRRAIGLTLLIVLSIYLVPLAMLCMVVLVVLEVYGPLLWGGGTLAASLVIIATAALRRRLIRSKKPPERPPPPPVPLEHGVGDHACGDGEHKKRDTVDDTEVTSRVPPVPDQRH